MGKNATQRSRTSPSTNDFANRRALEEAGIEFIEKNGGAEGAIEETVCIDGHPKAALSVR